MVGQNTRAVQLSVAWAAQHSQANNLPRYTHSKRQRDAAQTPAACARSTRTHTQVCKYSLGAHAVGESLPAPAVLFCLFSSQRQAVKCPTGITSRHKLSPDIRHAQHRVPVQRNTVSNTTQVSCCCLLHQQAKPPHDKRRQQARTQTQHVLYNNTCCCRRSQCVCGWLKPAEVKSEGLAAVLVKVTAHTYQRVSLHTYTHSSNSQWWSVVGRLHRNALLSQQACLGRQACMLALYARLRSPSNRQQPSHSGDSATTPPYLA